MSVCRGQARTASSSTRSGPSNKLDRPDRSKAAVSEIRVFISSTFRDMQAEREHLVKHVFPELRRYCREKGIAFSEIDLRWGITEAEARRGDVVRICLDEIDACRPFFIGIVGDRYGWVPDFSDPALKREAIERMPQAAEAIERGCSLLELEILYGALADPAAAHHAYLYLRTPASGLPPALDEDGAQDAGKLARLRQSIRASGLPVREVNDAAALGRLIRDDLMNAVDQLSPAMAPFSVADVESTAHEAFAATRRQAYVENPRYLRRLDEHVESAGPPLVVLGDSGAGKSSLLACWTDRYRRRNPEVPLIVHFVGATPTAGNVEIMRRVIAGIKERCGIEAPLPEQPEDIERDFPLWLARVQGERLVLVIDALDQLEGQSLAIRWLPTYIPPNIRLIVSTLKGPTLETLREREWDELTIQPLDPDAREAVIEAYLGEFRKQLTAKQLRRIAEDNQSSNPLFLRTLLEELRVFGRFEQLDARIAHYLSAIDLADLFQRVLERLEQDFGAEFVRLVMSSVWASRRGLSETELLEVGRVSRLKLSPLLHALDYHFARRAGLLNFFHRFMRQAVEKRYMHGAGPGLLREDGGGVAGAHLRLADYFEAQPPSPRRLDELPWQLYRAGAIDRLKDYLSSIETFNALASEGTKYELLEYWVAIGARHDVQSVYVASYARYEETEPNSKARADVLERLGAFLALASRYAGAEAFLRLALETRIQVCGERHPETARTLSELGDVLANRGDSTAALSLHRRALDVVTEVFGTHNLDTVKTMESLGLSLITTAQYVEAERYFRESLSIRESLQGPSNLDTAQALEYVARTLNLQGKYAAADPLYRRVLALRERALDADHPLIAFTLNNFGWLLTNEGELGEAETMLRRALVIVRKAFGPHSKASAAVLNNLSDVLYDKGEYEAAEACAREALDIRERSFGKTHQLTALALVSVVSALVKQGKFEEAEPLARRSVEIWESIDPDHSDHTDGLRTLAEILILTGRLDEAEPLASRALAIAESTVGAQHRDARLARQVLESLKAIRQEGSPGER